MPNLLAMSRTGALAPSFTLHWLDEGRTLPDGWGLGDYPRAQVPRNWRSTEGRQVSREHDASAVELQ